MLLLIAGWTVLPGAAWVWTLLAALTPAVPPLFNAALALAHGVKNSSYRAALRPLRDDALRWLLFVAFLPYEAQLMLDAILTTLGRLFTRKDLLQWTTAAHTVRVFGDEATPTATLVKMLPSTLAVAVLAVLSVCSGFRRCCSRPPSLSCGCLRRKSPIDQPAHSPGTIRTH